MSANTSAENIPLKGLKANPTLTALEDKGPGPPPCPFNATDILPWIIGAFSTLREQKTLSPNYVMHFYFHFIKTKWLKRIMQITVENRVASLVNKKNNEKKHQRFKIEQYFISGG